MVITFIIPSLNRPTLGRTVDSLIAQTDPRWLARVVYDGVEGPSFPDTRLTSWTGPKLGKPHMAGPVRNLAWFFEDITTPWLGFVDDDDSLCPDYVSRLDDEYDLIVFQMLMGGKLLPEISQNKRIPTLRPGNVGISFAVKTAFKYKHNIQFSQDRFEDWRFIKDCLDQGATYKIESLGYKVGA